jgi:hypothetical protein
MPHPPRTGDRLPTVSRLSINQLVAPSDETPVGGAKDSGAGREGGVDGLPCCMVGKNVSRLRT